MQGFFGPASILIIATHRGSTWFFIVYLIIPYIDAGVLPIRFAQLMG